MNDISSEFLLRRRLLGMTQKQLSERTGIGVDTISRIEASNMNNFTIDTAKKIAKGLGIKEITIKIY